MGCTMPQPKISIQPSPLQLSLIHILLGKEYIAEETVVTIQDQNETTAAVSGPLDRNTKVIVSSNKNIFAGDRIRLQTP